MKPLRLATFNVQHFCNYGTDEIDYPAFTEALNALDADIVGINESYGPGGRCGERAQIEIPARALAMNSFFAPACVIPGWGIYGNSLLSRFAIVEAESVPIPDPEPRKYNGYYETRCVLLATLLTDAGPLTVAETHFGLNPDEHENAVRTLEGLIRPERFVLMGDLNVTPEDPVLSPIRTRLRDTADALGDRTLSFSSDAPDRRIDYIFVSPDIEILAADIPAVTVSDHRPYLACVDI